MPSPTFGCYWYHKGKTFQANHNDCVVYDIRTEVVIDTTKVRLFKQITTGANNGKFLPSCYWYHKGKTFQANHNYKSNELAYKLVVIDTTKVRLFKQITTSQMMQNVKKSLLLIPQR